MGAIKEIYLTIRELGNGQITTDQALEQVKILLEANIAADEDVVLNSTMTRMNVKDLRSLKPGDRVFQYGNGEFRHLSFVGLMPGHSNYLIFCEGEYLTNLYIADKEKDEDYVGEWYAGKSDNKFMAARLIEFYNKRIKTVKKVYLKEK